MKAITWVVIAILIILGAVWYVQSNKAVDTNPAAPLADGISSNTANVGGSVTSDKNMHIVTIVTNKGTIKFETYDSDAPKTVQNFITLANKKFYDGLIFHRVVKGFVIQGGDPSGNGTGGPGYKFEDELNPNTQSYKNGYKKGVVAMANAGPNTNGSQFFITLADVPLPNAYTIFGKVIEGQDVVDAIGQAAVGVNDMPTSKIVMEKVTVENK